MLAVYIGTLSARRYDVRGENVLRNVGDAFTIACLLVLLGVAAASAAAGPPAPAKATDCIVKPSGG